jgi:hypothetical protein
MPSGSSGPPVEEPVSGPVVAVVDEVVAVVEEVVGSSGPGPVEEVSVDEEVPSVPGAEVPVSDDDPEPLLLPEAVSRGLSPRSLGKVQAGRASANRAQSEEERRVGIRVISER